MPIGSAAVVKSSAIPTDSSPASNAAPVAQRMVTFITILPLKELRDKGEDDVVRLACSDAASESGRRFSQAKRVGDHGDGAQAHRGRGDHRTK